MRNYKFTIFTPCYNGARTIKRVFDSVEAQTYTDFEWIIVNDGSNDNSDFVIRELIDRSPVKYKIRYIIQENMGKHRTWNNVVDLAEGGGMFLPADCDDTFVPNTLEFLNDKINEISGEDICCSSFSGVNVCCYDPKSEEMVGTPYPRNGLVTNNIELDYKYKIRGEHWGCIRTDLLKTRLFPEVKGHYYSENFLWYSLARDYSVVCYNEPLRGYYIETNSLTHDKTLRLDYHKARMELHYNWWCIQSLGGRILRYSILGYIKIWLSYIKSILKCILSTIADRVN